MVRIVEGMTDKGRFESNALVGRGHTCFLLGVAARGDMGCIPSPALPLIVPSVGGASIGPNAQVELAPHRRRLSVRRMPRSIPISWEFIAFSF
jgi:hypothetical protein